MIYELQASCGGMRGYMRKNSIKNTRINGEVQKELSILISRELKDPRIHPMTSVVTVEVAPDLKSAKVYVSVLGTQDEMKETLKGLKSAASFLRGQLAKTLNLRNTPELIFIMDNSIEYGVHMSQIIHDINKDLTVETDEDEYEEDDEDDMQDDEAFEEDEDEKE